MLSEILEKRIEFPMEPHSRPHTIYDQRRKSSKLVNIDKKIPSQSNIIKPATLPDPNASRPKSPEIKRQKLNKTNRFAILDEESENEDQSNTDMDIETASDVPSTPQNMLESQENIRPINHSQTTKTTRTDTSNLKQSQEPQKVSQKIPPIVLRDKEKWIHLSNILKNSKVVITKARVISIGVSLYPATSDDFRRAIQIIRKEGLSHHTYQLPEEKNLHVILRGIPEPVSSEDIKDELEANGFLPIRVHRLTRFKDKHPLPLVSVVLPRDQKHIFQLESLLYVKITVETQRKRPGMSQCHRCQLFGHSQNYCTAPPRCVKCAGTHQTSDCTKLPTMPATCANCGKNHPASYKGCEKWPKLPNKGTPTKTVTPKSSYSTITKVNIDEKSENLATIFDKFQEMYKNMQTLANQLNNLFGLATKTSQK